MRKFVGLFTAGIVAASLLAGFTIPSVAAGNGGAAGKQSEADGAQVGTENTEAGTEGASDTLVLYYSASGNTKKIADLIAEDTGADEFEITPSDPYTDEDLNYNDDSSRVVKEYQDKSLQDVAFDSYDVPDWDSYDTVFVGYPIWWQDASWVMKSFVGHLDFTGKTVIPFATSSVSGIGDSGKNLEEIAGTGSWLEGERFSGHSSGEDVQKWIDTLNL